MCLAKAYLKKWDDEPVLQDIARIRLHGERVELETLLGEEKVIPGRVVEVDFATSRILLESTMKPISPDKGEGCHQTSTAL